jgi:hypothetical protein
LIDERTRLRYYRIMYSWARVIVDAGSYKLRKDVGS